MSELYFKTYFMPAAPLGPPNPLPDLRSTADAHAHVEVDETVSLGEARYMGYAPVRGILPYTMQDGYSRMKRRKRFETAVLENEHLRATLLPELGGRLWSLYDKDAGRELLHVNPVFQPCNLALRNAWFSGGVEWNVGIIGHSPLTAEDMACEALELADGTPALRMYQYERIRRLLYRVEFFLPEETRALYVRVRIDNTSDQETAVYWWSNMAVDEREDVRVIVPADKAFHYGYGRKLTKVPVPVMRAAPRARAWDVSRPTCLPQAMDFFFDVKPDARPFIAAVGADGYGVCQTSTRALRGRKLFVWGMGAGGRHWQTFLAQEGCAYIELQSGLARTQLEHLPMGGRKTISWLETYGPVQVDPARAQGPDWEGAVSATAEALTAQRGPAETLEMLHAWVAHDLDGQSGGRVVHRGMGFARVEKLLLGDAFHTAGLSLKAMYQGAQERPWGELATKGELPCPPPEDPPLSYQTGEAWERALEGAIASGRSAHWFAYYHLGVMRAARGADGEAREAFERSLALEENAWALRCLAVLDARAGEEARAADRLCRAVEMVECRPLVLEALEMLERTDQYERMLRLIEGLPEPLRGRARGPGRIDVYAACASIRAGRYDEARRLLGERIVLPDLREGDTRLSDLWFELCARERFGCADDQALAWARKNVRLPRYLDFRMR